MTRHIMVDLETWGTTPGCDIRSIGAVVFDPIEGTLGDTFYVNVIGGEQYGLTRDPATEKWWSEQSLEARTRLTFDQQSLRTGLIAFGSWWSWRDEVKCGGDYARFWAHGPHFDEQILAAAFRATGIDVPWHYRSPRDLRTVLEAAGLDPKDSIPSYGVEHNALDDAKAQALGVIEAYKRLKTMLPVATEGLIVELALLRHEHSRRVSEVLRANNREVERRRGGEALLREAAGLLRFCEEAHRGKVIAAAEIDDLGANAARIDKAEREAALAGRIESFLTGVSVNV